MIDPLHPKNLTDKTIITPEGKIRPGNNRPYHKATLVEQEERIDFCLKLLIRDASKALIHKAMQDKYNLDWRTVDDIYIVRAQKLRILFSAITQGEMRDIIITRLREILRTGKDGQVIAACNSLMEIYGLKAPTRVEQGGIPGGEPIKTVMEVRRTMILPLKDVEALRLREAAPEIMDSN